MRLSEQRILLLHRQFGHLVLAAVLRHSYLVQTKLLENNFHALELPYVLMTSDQQETLLHESPLF